MTLEKWAAQHGCSIDHAHALRSTFVVYKQLGENALNGIMHRRTWTGAKSDHSRAWLYDRSLVGDQIEEIARAAGFDRVDFGVGLVPVLEKGNDTCIMIPLADNEDD